MIFSGDLSGYQVAVIKELPVEDATYVNGALLSLNTTRGTNYCEINAVPADIIGLYSDAGAILTGTIAAGTIEFKKITINPNAIYMAEYDKAATISATAQSTNDWTVGNDGQPGGWIWSGTSTDASYGLLMYVATETADTHLFSVATPTAATPTATDDLTYIHPPLTGPGAGNGMVIDLIADCTEILTDGTYTGVGLAVIDSFVTGDSIGGYQPLRYANHNDTVDSSYRFFSEITPIDHALNQK